MADVITETIDLNKKLNEKEASEFLSISIRTLRHIRAQNLVGFYRYNRKIFHSVKHLKEYQDRHEVKPISSKTRGKSQKSNL